MQGTLSALHVTPQINSGRKRFGVSVEIRAAGDSEKQAIREQDESKSYQKRALIALLFTPQTNELPGSVIKHPAEVPIVVLKATKGRKEKATE